MNDQKCRGHMSAMHRDACPICNPPAPPASNQCRYCNQPERPDGSIIHLGGCLGLERVWLNQLEYDRLVARATAGEAAPPASHQYLYLLGDPENDLFSDAMDRAAGTFHSVRHGAQRNAERAAEPMDGERLVRRALAAAFRSYLEEIGPHELRPKAMQQLQDIIDIAKTVKANAPETPCSDPGWEMRNGHLTCKGCGKTATEVLAVKPPPSDRRCSFREPWSGAPCCSYEGHDGQHTLNQPWPPSVKTPLTASAPSVAGESSTEPSIRSACEGSGPAAGGAVSHHQPIDKPVQR